MFHRTYFLFTLRRDVITQWPRYELHDNATTVSVTTLGLLDVHWSCMSVGATSGHTDSELYHKQRDVRHANTNLRRLLPAQRISRIGQIIKSLALRLRQWQLSESVSEQNELYDLQCTGGNLTLTFSKLASLQRTETPVRPVYQSGYRINFSTAPLKRFNK